MANFSKLIEQELTEAGRGKAEELSVSELYRIVSEALMRGINPVWNQCAEKAAGARRAYYLSAEFLVGRAVYNNMLNLGCLDEVRAYFTERGLDFNRFEEIEDAALGNGGLGRLAACFLDSAATHKLNVDGYGIRYRYGLFKQYFENGFQREAADDWQRFGDPWSVRRQDERVTVRFKGQSVDAVPYDMPVIGYGGERINTLRLWQAEPVAPFNFPAFDAGKYAESVAEREAAERISTVLYPNDNTENGRKLRLKQEYFFSSASLQDILRRFTTTFGEAYEKLPQYVTVQLNDTHPVVSVPELVRLLMERGLDFDAAFEICRNVFCYTNHTVMAEALEKWDERTFRGLLPEVYAAVKLIQKQLKKELTARGVRDTTAYDILSGGKIHMARMAVFAGRAVNGVAKIHTEILKADTLKEWYALYPERFYNKTNGITQRRWLALCNEGLADFITRRIGGKWVCDLDELEKLKPYADDAAALAEFAAIKRSNKQRLADYVEKREGVRLNPDFLFDIQIKRLHEYKRQLMNALSVLALYFKLKAGELPDFTPTAFLFGAKAAPGYRRAKAVIKFINSIAGLINNDPDMKGKLQVVFVADYNVSYAEKLVAAGDVSEQISAAGTEASGTGNMKLMLNGAVTLGTYDGANIEIAEAAGEENNYIFGARVEELKAIEDTYDPRAYYEADPLLKRAVDTLVDGTFDDAGTGLFEDLYASLLGDGTGGRADQYYVCKDFAPYLEAKLAVNRDYRDTQAFTRKCLLNTASAGRFSSDRTILEYAKEIWKLK